MAYKPQVDEDPVTAAIKKAMGAPSYAQAGDMPGSPDGPEVPGDMPLPGDPAQHTDPEPPRVEVPASAPSKPANPYDFSRVHGYDEAKFADPNKKSAKYVMGRTLSQFDPRQGITPEVLAALNALGYGTFSGQGDKLSLSGLTETGRGAGLTGDYQDADFIEALNSGNGHWGYADPAAEAESGAGANPSAVGPQNNNGALSLDPNGAPENGDFFSKLLDAARQSAGGNAQRKSLLSVMGL